MAASTPIITDFRPSGGCNSCSPYSGSAGSEPLSRRRFTDCRKNLITDSAAGQTSTLDVTGEAGFYRPSLLSLSQVLWAVALGWAGIQFHVHALTLIGVLVIPAALIWNAACRWVVDQEDFSHFDDFEE